jgi:transcriptional regulator with XRE-family HTH domain
MTRSSTLDPELAAVLRQMREERGITREVLAYRAGVTVSGLARIEQGKVAPGWGTVRRLAQGLGVSMVELSAAVEGKHRPACAAVRRSHFSRR